MLTKEIIIDQVTVAEMGEVHVRTATKVSEGGTLLSTSYNRHVVLPGADYSKETARVKSICATVHTPSAIVAFNASVAR